MHARAYGIAVGVCLLVSGCGPMSNKLLELAARLFVAEAQKPGSVLPRTDDSPGTDRPVEYVRHRIAELDARERELQTVRHRFAADAIKLTREAEADSVLSAQRAQKLVELKAAYRSASDHQHWPLELSGVPIAEDEAQRLIVSAYGSVARSANKRAAYKRAATKRLAAVAEADRALRQLAEQRLEIREKLRLIELQQDKDAVKGVVAQIDGLYADAMAFDTKNAEAIDVDDLLVLDNRPTQKENADFALIMQK
ncbi:MAG: hypothetical protein RLZZ450_1035 [Pseudomonadota bacterium]